MASSSYTYTLSPTAYALPLLHAAGHPSSSVQGVFLADTSSASTASSTTGSGRRPLEIVDAVPLIHAEATLTPIIEAGLEIVKAYADKKGLTIVGMYEVSEGVALSRAARAFLAGLERGWEGSFSLTVRITRRILVFKLTGRWM
jgi:hypothetical protein